MLLACLVRISFEGNQTIVSAAADWLHMLLKFSFHSNCPLPCALGFESNGPQEWWVTNRSFTEIVLISLCFKFYVPRLDLDTTMINDWSLRSKWQKGINRTYLYKQAKYLCLPQVDSCENQDTSGYPKPVFPGARANLPSSPLTSTMDVDIAKSFGALLLGGLFASL